MDTTNQITLLYRKGFSEALIFKIYVNGEGGGYCLHDLLLSTNKMSLRIFEVEMDVHTQSFFNNNNWYAYLKL